MTVWNEQAGSVTRGRAFNPPRKHPKNPVKSDNYGVAPGGHFLAGKIPYHETRVRRTSARPVRSPDATWIGDEWLHFRQATIAGSIGDEAALAGPIAPVSPGRWRAPTSVGTVVRRRAPPTREIFQTRKT